MKPTFALGLPHAPWKPGRKESFARLSTQLGVKSLFENARVRACAVFDEKEPNWSWSAEMWRWATSTQATHFLQLQDDVLVAAEFWPALAAMVEAVPDQVIGLEVVHPAARALADEGNRWFTTSDGLVGVGYVMPTNLVTELLDWRASALTPDAAEHLTEDMLIGLWCLATGRRVWHPIPTIIDHDTSIPSTYGNDAHPARRPVVRWCDGWRDARLTLAETIECPSWWVAGSVDAPHLGRFYDASPALARRYVKGFGSDRYIAAKRDDGIGVKRQLGLRTRARLGLEPKYRVVVCTPTRGGTHPEYNASIWRLVHASDEILVENAVEVLQAWQWSDDLVRCRSRFVRAFLEGNGTHLFFVDADVSFEPVVLRGMLAAERDIVAAPYPKRDKIDFEAVTKPDAKPPEARAYAYPIRVEPGSKGSIDDANCTEVAGIGLGCALISRECLETMVEHYHTELAFDDVVQGEPHPDTVALFQLMLRGRELLSEDYSFCARWRAIGGTVHMYLGPGSPVNHHGEHAYRGMIEALGLKRIA